MWVGGRLQAGPALQVEEDILFPQSEGMEGSSGVPEAKLCPGAVLRLGRAADLKHDLIG